MVRRTVWGYEDEVSFFGVADMVHRRVKRTAWEGDNGVDSLVRESTRAGSMQHAARWACKQDCYIHRSNYQTIDGPVAVIDEGDQDACVVYVASAVSRFVKALIKLVWGPNHFMLFSLFALSYKYCILVVEVIGLFVYEKKHMRSAPTPA